MALRPEPATTRVIALHKLPVQLRMLVRLIGDAAAFRLAEQRGGTPLTIPVRFVDTHELVDLVGPQAAAELVAELGGQTLQLPKYDSVTRQLRHQRVLALRLSGRLLREVALDTGYTQRQVINVCNRAGVAEDAGGDKGAQPDLFDGMAVGEAEAGEADAALDELALPTAHNPFGLCAVGVEPQTTAEKL